MDLHTLLLLLRRRALLVAPALLLATELPAAAAQGIDDSAPARAPAQSTGPAAAGGLMRTAFGAAVVDGEVVAGGPDWKARFPAGRAVFTPALGTRAERPMPLSFAFEAVERGSETIAAAGGAQAEVAGERISFAHDGGIVERYDVTADGLSQSFLIPEHPGGAGDLVVRGRIDTELAFAGPLAGGGLSFELPGAGGVHVGGVTAVDALGATAPGELRLDGTSLELVVPGAFVDAAAYPLVIDPEIGAALPVDDSTWDDGDPDVAASSHATTRYLAVWERRFAIGDVDIRGIRIDEDGASVGSLLFLESGDAVSNSPAVGHVHLTQRFFVAWQEAASIFSPFQIVGRGVDAADGDLSSALTVSPSANQQSTPDVGGERTTVDNDVFVIWDEATLGIRGRQVTAPAGGSVSTVGSTVQISDLVGGPEHLNPSISKSAGDAGRFGLAYQAATGPSAGVFYRTISRNGTELTGAYLLLSLIGGPHSRPAIDGDGTNFMLVFERGEPGFTGNLDIWAGTFSHDGTGLHNIDFQPIENDDLDEEITPDVAFTGGQFIVSYIDIDSGTANAYTKTVDPFTCLVCEGEMTLSATTGQDQDVQVAAHYAGGLAGSEALHVWETYEGDGDVLGQLFDSPYGQVVLPGGCGSGGAAYTPCPYAGHDDFAFHLGGAAPLAPAFLALSFQEQAFACGSCTLWPGLATADVFAAGLTDSEGRASLPVAIPPGTAGAVFTSQWAVAVPGAQCSVFGVDVSNGVRTTVETADL